jgi:hypothetical protein
MIVFTAMMGLWLSAWPTAFAQTDPGAPGPMAVTVTEYDYGDTAFTLTEIPDNPLEVRAGVIHTTDLSGRSPHAKKQTNPG